jgi:hypothetical protein
MALLDSTSLKFSNDILFVIFGRRNQKIWISKDLAQIQIQILFWFLFEPEKATWRFLIHPY